jgi:toxin ParE1/3/4
MAPFRLTFRAEADIDAIWDYIAVVKHSPQAADNQIESLYARFNLLADHPLMGQLRSDLRTDLRVFSVENYVILYFPAAEGIEVIGVLHGARDIESIFRRGER